jgi:hypothetical protein
MKTISTGAATHITIIEIEARQLKDTMISVAAAVLVVVLGRLTHLTLIIRLLPIRDRDLCLGMDGTDTRITNALGWDTGTTITLMTHPVLIIILPILSGHIAIDQVFSNQVQD